MSATADARASQQSTDRVMATSLDHAVATAQISMVQIWGVRRTLELPNRRTRRDRAQRRRSADDRRLAEAREPAGTDVDVLTRHDIAFHQTIAQAGRNVPSLQIIRSFAPMVVHAVPATWATRTTRQRTAVFAHHHAVALAIADRDPKTAVVAMNTHFVTSIGDLLVRREMMSSRRAVHLNIGGLG